MSSSTTSSEMTPSPPRSPSPPATTDELETYKPLFRRRKPPVSEPPVPCLRCALVDMHCVCYRGEVRCQRCERNGEEVCVLQRQDLTKAETRLTQHELEELRKEAAQARGPQHSWLMSHQLPPAPEPLQCMVYSRDPEFSGEGGRKRLLAIAADVLAAVEAEGTTYVHGQPVAAADARNFVLPNWQKPNDWREKRDSSPEYRKRAAFFECLTAEQAAATARSRGLSLERRRAREMSADRKRKEREEKEQREKAEAEAVAEAEAAREQEQY